MEDATETKIDDAKWAIVEIMGHRQHAGRISEAEQFGAKMLRIDVPVFEAPGEGEKDPKLADWKTHFYAGNAIFSLTPTDEQTAMRMNARHVEPYRYRLSPPSTDFSDDEDPF